MLQDEYKEHSKIDDEYQKLLSSWNNEQLHNPSTNIKRSKINKSEPAQFMLIHLFNDYLNQIWSDSQSMIQCAEVWASQQSELTPAESAFIMNIHALHLMKQSLRKRRQLFKIVDELNSICYVQNDKLYGSLYSSSGSTISQDYLTQQNFQKPEYGTGAQKIERDLTIQKDSEYFELEPNKQTMDSEPNRPVRLISSPSTPTISSLLEKGSRCSHNFTPACNFSTYFPRDDDTHKLSCHFCQKMIPLKKSFSVENLNSFQQGISNITDDEGSSVHDDDSSYDITSLYRYSKRDYQSEIAERELLLEELLLEDNDCDYTSKQFEHISDTEDSQKIEIEPERMVPSRRTYYKSNSYQHICNTTPDLPSKDYYESMNSKEVSLKKRSSKKNNRSMVNKSARDNVSVANRSGESRTGAFVSKSQKEKPNIKSAKRMSHSPSSIVRSFSSKNINLCNMFSTRKLNFATPNNK